MRLRIKSKRRHLPVGRAITYEPARRRSPVRTGVAIIGLGFIVARFRLFLRELGATNLHPLPTGVSTVFGVVLTLCGVSVSLLSLQRYRTADEGIERNEMAGRHSWRSR